MTTKTDTEQERAEFEAALGRGKTYTERDYQMYLLGRRAALQSQSNHDTTLFCDLKTDEEKCAFFLSGRGYETGVIAHSIQNDVAMAYHRCSEYQKEVEALKAECEKLRKDAETEQQPADHPAITHCDNCGCDWLDNGLNPIGCPYCKHPAPDVEALVEALQGLLNIVSDSSGVAGYHLNGNIADWDEFEEVENAEVALSTYSKQGAEE